VQTSRGVDRTRRQRPASAARLSARERERVAWSETIACPRLAETALDEARELERRGEVTAAIEAYRRAARSADVAGHALHRGGQLQRQLGEIQPAIETFKQALHASTTDSLRSVVLFVELGDCYGLLGDFDEAAYFYRRALTLQRGSVLESARDDVLRRLRAALLADSSPRATG